MKTNTQIGKLLNNVFYNAVLFVKENPSEKITSTIVNVNPREVKKYSDVFKTKLIVDVENENCFIEYQPFEDGCVTIRLESSELHEAILEAFKPVNNIKVGCLHPELNKLPGNVVTRLLASRAVIKSIENS
jgi:hypothetical protein